MSDQGKNLTWTWNNGLGGGEAVDGGVSNPMVRELDVMDVFGFMAYMGTPLHQNGKVVADLFVPQDHARR